MVWGAPGTYNITRVEKNSWKQLLHTVGGFDIAGFHMRLQLRTGRGCLPPLGASDFKAMSFCLSDEQIRCLV